MQEVDLIKLFIERFDNLGDSYIVTGSVASIIYGEPRLTHDIDIVIAIKKNSLERLYEIFPEKEFYIPPIEFLKLEAIRECRGHFNIIHFSSGLKADVYLAGKDEFLNWAINNRNEMNFKGIKLPLAPIEYIIVKKLEYYKEGKSEKHLNDIKSILENSSSLINRDLLKSFIEKFGLKDEWLLIAEK